MAKSVKLTDGSYIDGDGVFDTNTYRTMSQTNMYTRLEFASEMYSTITVQTRLANYADKSALFIFGNGNFATCCSLILSHHTTGVQAPVVNLGAAELTATYDRETKTFTISGIPKYGAYNILSTAKILSITKSE